MPFHVLCLSMDGAIIIMWHLNASGAPALFQSFQLFPPGTPLLVIVFIVTVVIVSAFVMVIIGFKNKFAALKV